MDAKPDRVRSELIFLFAVEGIFLSDAARVFIRLRPVLEREEAPLSRGSSLHSLGQ